MEDTTQQSQLVEIISLVVSTQHKILHLLVNCCVYLFLWRIVLFISNYLIVILLPCQLIYYWYIFLCLDSRCFILRIMSLLKKKKENIIESFHQTIIHFSSVTASFDWDNIYHTKGENRRVCGWKEIGTINYCHKDYVPIFSQLNSSGTVLICPALCCVLCYFYCLVGQIIWSYCPLQKLIQYRHCTNIK